MITVQDLAAASPWALTRSALDTLIGHAQRAEAFTPRTPAPMTRRRSSSGVVIPIHGVIEHRSSLLLDIFGADLARRLTPDGHQQLEEIGMALGLGIDLLRRHRAALRDLAGTIEAHGEIRGYRDAAFVLNVALAQRPDHA